MRHDDQRDARQRLHEQMRQARGACQPRGTVIRRQVGAALVAGTLVLSTVPCAAIAEESTGTAASAGASGSSQGAQSSQSQPPSMPDGGGQGGGGGGADTMTYDYSGTLSGALTADGTEQSSSSDVTATTADQNAALVQNGGTLDITGGTLTKSGDDTNGDNCNFYGINSILLGVGDGSTAYVSNATLSATSEGSNGIFSTDSATVYANSDAISTTAGNSRGLDATYGGTIVANDMTITTQGDHSAAIATDRGGGSISVTNSKLSTAGSGSPLLYSTGDIEVSGVTGTATGSQIAGMEGLNTILINDSTLESTQTDKTASDPIADGIIIYQSTSGDAESTTGEAATFQAVGSTLKSAITSGSMFYLTNTTANIVLSNATLDFDSSAANLLQAEGNDSNGWGTAGSNGATVNFTLIGEDVSGNIVADTISSVTAYLTEGTTWNGASSISTNSSATTTSDAPISVNVDSTSTWVVSADSTVTNLTVADGGKVVDSSGKTVKVVDSSGNTLVNGDSSVTVTVTGSYSTSYDSSGAGTVSTDLIDRSGFDTHYGTSTAFAMGDSSASTASASSDGADSSSAANSSSGSDSGSGSSGGWLAAIVSFFKGLFGLS